MCNTKARKLIAFSLSLAALLLTAGIFLAVERLLPTSHYVQVVEELPPLSDYKYQDLSRSLFYQGQPIALDRVTNTIYISHEITEDTTLQELFSPLRLTDSGYRMYVPCGNDLPPLSQCIRENHPFQLIISNRRGIHMKYQVVFTPLPVFSLEGHYSGTRSEPPFRDIYEGEFMLWTPLQSGDSSYSLTFSKAAWHLRGMTSAGRPKQPLKLNLKKGSGKKHRMNLLGLGEEDDWILNPMNMEDTKLREKFFAELWNQEHDLKMSRGKYTEAIIDGEYAGIYLIQRRIDGNYLELSPGDVLIKGSAFIGHTAPEEAYDVVYGKPEDIALMGPVYDLSDLSNVDIANFIDVNLFLLFADATDNVGQKNMFYLFRPEEQGYTLSFLPWDTDMTMGLVWRDEGFTYLYDSCTTSFMERVETDAVRRVYPQLDQSMAQRWTELRAGVLSQENIQDLLHSLQEQLDASGVLFRDRQSWGTLYHGADTPEAMESWLLDRLAVLDARFDAVLNSLP